jgi:hypothetical protein
MIKTRPVVAFFLLSLGISWAAWVPYAAAQSGLVQVAIPAELVWLAEFGPSLAALIVVGMLHGPAAVGDLLRKLTQWRVSPRWYLLAIGLTPALVLVSLGIDRLLFGTIYDLSLLSGWDRRFVERTSAFTPSMGIISGLVRFMGGSTLAAGACPRRSAGAALPCRSSRSGDAGSCGPACSWGSCGACGIPARCSGRRCLRPPWPAA